MQASSIHDREAIPEAWGEGHEKELTFQRGKQHKNRIEAFLDNLLLDEEIDDAFLQDVEQHRTQSCWLDAKLHRDQASKLEKLSMMGRAVDWDAWRGQLAWVHDFDYSAEIQRQFQLRFLERTALRQGATIFVVQDASGPGERVLVQASLKGGYVVDRSVLLGNSGLFLKYRAALKIRRSICITDAFAAGHAEIANAVTSAAPGSCWKVKQGNVAERNDLVLVTGQAAGRATGEANKAQFLSLIAKLDFGRSGYWRPGRG